MFYSMVDQDGFIVKAQYTQNSDAVVYEGMRLLPDNPPVFDASNFQLKRIEPIPFNASEVLYELINESSYIFSEEK